MINPFETQLKRKNLTNQIISTSNYHLLDNHFTFNNHYNTSINNTTTLNNNFLPQFHQQHTNHAILLNNGEYCMNCNCQFLLDNTQLSIRRRKTFQFLKEMIQKELNQTQQQHFYNSQINPFIIIDNNKVNLIVNQLLKLSLTLLSNEIDFIKLNSRTTLDGEILESIIELLFEIMTVDSLMDNLELITNMFIEFNQDCLKYWILFLCEMFKFIEKNLQNNILNNNLIKIIEKLLIFLQNYLNEDIKTSIYFILHLFCKNIYEKEIILNLFNENIFLIIFENLIKSDCNDLQMNILALFFTIISFENILEDLNFIFCKHFTKMNDAIISVILSTNISIQLLNIKIIFLLSKNCKDLLQYFIQSDITDFLFEILKTNSNILLETILLILNLFLDLPNFINKFISFGIDNFITITMIPYLEEGKYLKEDEFILINKELEIILKVLNQFTMIEIKYQQTIKQLIYFLDKFYPILLFHLNNNEEKDRVLSCHLIMIQLIQFIIKHLSDSNELLIDQHQSNNNEEGNQENVVLYQLIMKMTSFISKIFELYEDLSIQLMNSSLVVNNNGNVELFEENLSFCFSIYNLIIYKKNLFNREYENIIIYFEENILLTSSNNIFEILTTSNYLPLLFEIFNFLSNHLQFNLFKEENNLLSYHLINRKLFSTLSRISLLVEENHTLQTTMKTFIVNVFCEMKVFPLEKRNDLISSITKLQLIPYNLLNLLIEQDDNDLQKEFIILFFYISFIHDDYLIEPQIIIDYLLQFINNYNNLQNLNAICKMKCCELISLVSLGLFIEDKKIYCNQITLQKNISLLFDSLFSLQNYFTISDFNNNIRNDIINSLMLFTKWLSFQQEEFQNKEMIKLFFKQLIKLKKLITIKEFIVLFVNARFDMIQFIIELLKEEEQIDNILFCLEMITEYLKENITLQLSFISNQIIEPLLFIYYTNLKKNNLNDLYIIKLLKLIGNILYFNKYNKIELSNSITIYTYIIKILNYFTFNYNISEIKNINMYLNIISLIYYYWIENDYNNNIRVLSIIDDLSNRLKLSLQKIMEYIQFKKENEIILLLTSFLQLIILLIKLLSIDKNRKRLQSILFSLDNYFDYFMNLILSSSSPLIKLLTLISFYFQLLKVNTLSINYEFKFIHSLLSNMLSREELLRIYSVLLIELLESNNGNLFFSNNVWNEFIVDQLLISENELSTLIYFTLLFENVKDISVKLINSKELFVLLDELFKSEENTEVTNYYLLRLTKQLFKHSNTLPDENIVSRMKQWISGLKGNEQVLFQNGEEDTLVSKDINDLFIIDKLLRVKYLEGSIPQYNELLEEMKKEMEGIP
ncbi:hypothetical protein ABK040_014339 [Willaertia magna]